MLKLRMPMLYFQFLPHDKRYFCSSLNQVIKYTRLYRSLGGFVARACGRARVRVPAEADTKNCGRRKPSDYVSFRRAVEWQRFHTLNKHDTKPRTTLLTNALHFGPGYRSVPTRCRSLISSRMTDSVVCLRKRFPPTSYTWNPSKIWYQGINHWVANGG